MFIRAMQNKLVMKMLQECSTSRAPGAWWSAVCSGDAPRKTISTPAMWLWFLALFTSRTLCMHTRTARSLIFIVQHWDHNLILVIHHHESEQTRVFTTVSRPTKAWIAQTYIRIFGDLLLSLIWREQILDILSTRILMSLRQLDQHP